MTNLFVGKNVEVIKAICDICKETKKCAVIERSIWQSKYKTEIKGFFNIQEVVTDTEITSETFKMDICGDCAKQISKQLL